MRRTYEVPEERRNDPPPESEKLGKYSDKDRAEHPERWFPEGSRSEQPNDRYGKP